MGHINLATPVVHVWFFKGAPSKISLLLDVPPRATEQVIYFARYLVLGVEDEKKKEALLRLEKSKEERTKELDLIYKERVEVLRTKAGEDKEKVKGKIKDKEQLSLTLGEIDLDLRKKEAAMGEEKKNTLEKTHELYTNLTSTVSSLKPLS